ncbi:unnamed protein product [Rotaria sp. Silwood2]|nr:unnamed protein product [Rotaria sp. Silwood2]CAF4691237.1 unnamed protein product [Rotaria sp. Silwood2]
MESTTLSGEKLSTSTIKASPIAHIRSSSTNLSFKSASSSLASTNSNSAKPLSAVEAIVAEYLSPKQSTTLTTRKRLIKRSYGVSVTDLDVYGENIVKQ